MSDNEQKFDFDQGTEVTVFDQVKRELDIQRDPMEFKVPLSDIFGKTSLAPKASFGQVTFKENIDIAILDPSRKGVHFEALKWVINLSPSRIIYVSCNVSSFKNDMRVLETSYEIDKIIPLDMFPQTKHVECIVNLKKVTS